MSNTVMMHTRIDRALKDEAEQILANIGLTPSEAIRLFFHRVRVERALPLKLTYDASYPDLNDAERDALDAEDLAAYNTFKANPPTGKPFHTLLNELGITDAVNKRQSA